MIQEVDGKLEVKSPYHPDFPKHAKNLGGRWDGSAKVWRFDMRDEASVRDLCRDCFGTDGSVAPELVDCRLTLRGTQGQAVWFAGREVARRPNRDYPVRLGRGVVVLNGGEFTSSGGSRKSPRINFRGVSITLEIRDVPLVLARREQSENPENVIILGNDTPEPSALDRLREVLAPLTDDEITVAALEFYWLHVKSEKGDCHADTD